MNNSPTNGSEEIQKLDAVQGLRNYLEARANAQAAATQIVPNGRPLTGFQQADSARYLRASLRQVGEEIVAEHPEFAELWCDDLRPRDPRR